MRTLAELRDTSGVEQLLVAGALPAASAAVKAPLFAKAAETIIAAGANDSCGARAYLVPGRIEVLGKHTDYCGGRSLIMAADRGFCMVVAPRDDSTVRIFALDLGDSCEFEISPDLSPVVGHWSNYPMTVARRLARNFVGAARGADIAFASDLPLASGMSSSSALMIAIFLALDGVNGFSSRPEYLAEIKSREDLAGYLGTVENGQSFGLLAGDKGVGTFGGSQDHTAILCGRAGGFCQYSYSPVVFERVLPFPEGYAMAVCSCGVAAEKTGEAMARYNRASQLASAAVAAWNQSTDREDRHFAEALAEAGGQAELIRDVLKNVPAGEAGGERGERGKRGERFTANELMSRFDQFHADSEEIIPAAGDALLAGDIVAFGREVSRSQALADSLLGNQIPQTNFLAASALECGAVAASAFGAGFGGSVWAMVSLEDSDGVLGKWQEAYGRAYPEAASRASFFLTQAGPAAFELG